MKLEYSNGKLAAKQQKFRCASTEPNKNNDTKNIKWNDAKSFYLFILIFLRFFPFSFSFEF